MAFTLTRRHFVHRKQIATLAYEWGKIDRQVKIALAQGEYQRDRVLTEVETEKYLKACPQPWKDCATIILDEASDPVKSLVCVGSTCC